MKLPSYLKTKMRYDNDTKQLLVRITIKKWGIPIIAHKCLRNDFDLKWWQWLYYPFLCFKMWRNFNG